jgi:hypothetical protein
VSSDDNLKLRGGGDFNTLQAPVETSFADIRENMLFEVSYTVLATKQDIKYMF